MKKSALVLTVLAFIMGSTNLVFAEWFSKDKDQPVKIVTESQAVAKKPAGKVQEMLAKKKSDLNGTEWEIQIKGMSPKAKAEKDILIFVDNKVSSKNMGDRGFEATNYSLRLLEDNETYTWETMQVSEKSGTAFWRGDIGSDGVMRGVVSVRNKKNAVTDYNFYSLQSQKAAPAAVAVAPVVEAPAVEAPAAQ